MRAQCNRPRQQPRLRWYSPDAWHHEQTRVKNNKPQFNLEFASENKKRHETCKFFVWRYNLKRYCPSIVTAVLTRHSRPVLRRCRVKFELIISASENNASLRVVNNNNGIGKTPTCDIFAVCWSSSTAAEDVGSKIVDLLAVLVSNNGPFSRSCIRAQNYSVLYQ